MSSEMSQEPAETSKSPKMNSPIPKIPTPKFRIVLTAVQVFPLASQTSMTSRLVPKQSFIVQARFQLQGEDVRSLTAQEHFFEVKVYTNEMTSGSTKLLTTYRAKLIRDVMEYDVRREVPGLLPGLYRISIVIFLRKPVKLGGFYDKTIIHVI